MLEQRFYGRKREAESLETILHSVLKENEIPSTATKDPLIANTGGPRSSTNKAVVPKCQWNCQLVLVSGAAGSGKRTFARSVLQRNLGSSTGSPFLLAVGRFRRSRRRESSGSNNSNVVDDRPFSAINEAIHELLSTLTLENTNEAMSSIRQRLHQLSSEDLEVLASAFPSVKHWLHNFSVNPQTSEIHGKASSPASLKAPVLQPVLLGSHFVAQQTQVLSPVLIRFLKAVLSRVPLVLLLEDMQYADESSLILVEALMNENEKSSTLKSDVESKGLMIVVTSQEEDELSGLDAFIRFLKRCQEMRVLLDSLGDTEEFPTTSALVPNRCFHHILLSDLTWEDTFEWVQAASGGNFQFCSMEQKREIADLTFHHSGGNPLRLRYCLLFLNYDDKLLQEIEVLHKKSVPKSICDLYAAILLQQDGQVQHIVKTAAALAHLGDGNVDCNILEVAAEMPCNDTVIFAHKFGLLEYDCTRDYVRFCHEHLRKVAYDGIPFNDRASLHLDIGRRVWRSALQEQKELCDDKIIGKFLLATQQLRNCIHLLADLDERLYMAQLCFEAGQKPSMSGDFHTAAKLFEFSLLVMGPVLWRPDLYETSLVLHNAAAQAYYTIGDFKKMELTLDLIFDHAMGFRDKLSAYVILVYATGTRLKLLEAFRTSCFALSELGEPVNQNPSTFNIIAQFVGMKLLLRGKSDEYFRNLPIAEDADYQILTQLLNFAMFFSYVVHAEIGVLLCFRLIRLSMKNGITGASVTAFASYGFLLCTLGSFDDGYRYGMLSMELVQKFKVWGPRVQMLVYGYIYYWVHPFRDSWEPLQHAQCSALKCGDLEVYSGSTSFYLFVHLSCGSSLLTLEPSARSFCCSLDFFGQKNPLIFAVPIWGFMSDLSGNTDPLNVSGEIKDVATALKYAVKEENKYVVGSYYMLRTMWFYLIGEYSDALQMAKKSVEYRQVSDHNLTFYEALASLAMAESSRGLTRRKHRSHARMLTKRMKGWAHRCPENFLNKQLLLEAESAVLSGNTEEAISLFEQSICKAKKEGFCHEEGIAYERLGHYQLSQGQVSNAEMSYERARVAFDNWGATALVQRMDTFLSSEQLQEMSVNVATGKLMIAPCIDISLVDSAN